MDLAERAKRIKLILMDVDGTLTDGTLTLLPDGEELKSYHVRDGMGIIMAWIMGIGTGIITGKQSAALEKRAKRLRIKILYQGILDKGGVLDEIMVQHRLSQEEIAFIGDDLGDLAAMKAVGLAAAVADAHPLIKSASHMVCSLPGGHGAVREFIDFILESKGYTWQTIEQKLVALERRQQGEKKRAEKTAG